MSLENALQDMRSKIGTETRVSDWVEVTQKRINQFAEATGDHQWIHVDVERAQKESPFGTTIAHGFFTLSLLPYLAGLGGKVGAEYGVKMGVNYGSNRLRFPHPVPVGCRLRLRTVLKSIEAVEGQNALHLINENTFEIEGIDKPACVVESVSRMYF
jgi:acyl dehydratase